MLKVEAKENRAALKAAISRYEQVTAIERGVDEILAMTDHDQGSTTQ